MFVVHWNSLSFSLTTTDLHTSHRDCLRCPLHSERHRTERRMRVLHIPCATYTALFVMPYDMQLTQSRQPPLSECPTSDPVHSGWTFNIVQSNLNRFKLVRYEFSGSVCLTLWGRQLLNRTTHTHTHTVGTDGTGGRHPTAERNGDGAILAGRHAIRLVAMPFAAIANAPHTHTLLEPHR